MIITPTKSQLSISIVNGKWSATDPRFFPPVVLFAILIIISAIYSTIVCCGKKKKPTPRKAESDNKQKPLSSTTGEETGGAENRQNPQDPYEQRYRSRKTPASKKAIQSTVPYRLAHVKTIQQKIAMDDETGLHPDQFKKQTKFDFVREVKLPKAIFANTVAQQTSAPKQIFRPAKEVDLGETVCKTEFPTTDEATGKKDAGKTADGYGELGVGHGGPGKHGTYIFASNLMEPGPVEDAGLAASPLNKAAKISGTKFEKLTPQKLLGPTNFGPPKQPHVTAFPIVKYPKVVCVEEYGTMPAVPPNALKATKLVKVVKREEKVPANVYNTMAGINKKMKTSRKRWFFM